MPKNYKRFRSDVEKDLHRIYITISPEAINWFHEIGIKMKKSKGYKLPRSYIIRALVDICMKLDIRVEGIKTEKELGKRVLEAVKRYQ